MKTQIEKQPKSTYKLTVTVPSEKVKEAYEQVMADVIKNAEVPGFRKGMAPSNIVKERTDQNKVYGEVINKVLQSYYTQAVKEHKLSPISNPRVEIKEFDLDKDFEFTALVATRPEVKVGDFRKSIKELQAKKEQQIKEENAKKLAAGEQIEDSHTHLSSNEVIDAILEASSVEIPDLLIEEEAERMMAKLIDQSQSIGLSLDQYLKAQNKSAEQLREDYAKIAERNLRAEFVLSEAIKNEKVEVSDEEILDIVKASGAPNAEEQLNDPIQKWYIKSILEKNKLISNLIEEVAHNEHKE